MPIRSIFLSFFSSSGIEPGASPRRRRCAALPFIAALGAATGLHAQIYNFSLTGTATAAPNGSDTPNYLFIDSDGQFYYQNAYSQYNTNPGEHIWNFYKGTNVLDPGVTLSQNNSVYNTQAMCTTGNPVYNEFYSVAGRTPGNGYDDGNYCDVIGIWVDPDTGHWYGIVHNEIYPNMPRIDAISYAISSDHGRSWTLQDPIITSPYGVGNTGEYYYYYGDGDPRLVVDTANGYFYLFYISRIMAPSGAGSADHTWEHVARAPISRKMAPGSWQKYYDGAWQEVQGIDWTCDPYTTICGAGAVASSMESNIGSVGDPVTRQNLVQPIYRQTPEDLNGYSNSTLTNMYVSWNVYLQKYIALVSSASARAMLFYVSDDLGNETWQQAGSVPYPNTGVWYQWMVDAGGLVSTNNLGSTFLAYCTFECSTYSSEYVRVNVSTGSLPVYYTGSGGVTSPTSTYFIAQPGAHLPAKNAGNAWTFVPVGDGYFGIRQAGAYLQVDANTQGRAWGAAVKSAAAIPSTSAASEQARQQWRFEKIAGSTGTGDTHYRLVNRYNNLALSLPPGEDTLTSGNLSRAVMAPVRDWDPAAGTATVKVWTVSAQTLIFTAQ